MSTKSYTSLRRLSAHVLTLLLVCVSFSKGAEGQAATPLVTASVTTNLTPPTGLGKVFQTAVDSFGDLLVEDYANGGLYEYPSGGGAVITLLPAGSLGSYANPGIAIGANNDLYLEGNYNNTLGRFPYDPATKSWDGLSTISSANSSNSGALCPKGSGTPAPPYGFTCGDTPNTNPYYLQPWALFVDASNNVVITANNSNNFVFIQPVVGTGITSTAAQANSLSLVAAAARSASVAEDKFGNIYIVEESDQKGPLPGVLMIPAGSAAVASDATLARVDPNLPAVTGVTVDAAGNLYISDSKEGVFFVPNPTGTPQTSAATLLSPTPAYGQASIDLARNILYIPTYDASGSQVIAAITFNAAELGTAATGAVATNSVPVSFGFNGAVTPASFAIEESGVTVPDFTVVSGGTCTAGQAYAALGGCTVNVALSPHAAGSVSAKLQMLDASGNLLDSIDLHGMGTGSAVQVLPGTESAIGSGLKTPVQVAADANGDVFVADSGTASISEYVKTAGSPPVTTAVGTGLTAPTGVATDGSGNLFIADSGTVYEIATGASGLNAATQVPVKASLGTNLKLAADGSGNLYIADPDNHRVVKLSSVGGTFSLYSQLETDFTGFTAPSAIAVDPNENVYVADGTSLYQITPAGTQSTLLTGLSGVTGLSIDPSGAVYYTAGGLAYRIPTLNGTLTQASQTPIAADVTGAVSVALDPSGNVYLLNTAAGNVIEVASTVSFNFGTLSSTTGSASQTYSILDNGNAPLNVTGFAGTADFGATADTCVGTPIAINSTCSVTITFSPGPGDQGALTGAVLVTGDEANAPVGVDGTGVGAALAASTTAVTVANPNVDASAAVVTVTPTANTGATPTGQVTLTVAGASLKAPITATGTLDATGKVTLSPTQLVVGTYTYTVNYAGDRTYSPSAATATVTIAPGAVTVVQPTMAAVQAAAPTYPLVLAGASGAAEPYDGSVTQFEYIYPVQVVATDGAPLVGQPIFDASGKQVSTNYGSVTFQGAPALGCVPVAVNADGTAPFSTSCFTIDTSNNSIPDLMSTFTITPVYSPTATGNYSTYTNPNYTAATGSAITFTALRNPVVQISSNPSTLAVTSGSTATATLTLSSLLGYGVAGSGALLNNYSLPVQLSCDGLPAYATCSFVYPQPASSDPNSVAVGPAAGTVLSYQGAAAAPCTVAQGCAGPGTVMMTITTNVPTGLVAVRRGSGEPTFAAMFGLGVLGLAFGRRKSMKGRMVTLMGLLLCCGVVAGISGCSTTQLGTSTQTSSPSGSYNVIVTAKQVGSQVITAYPYITYGNTNQVSLPFTMKVTVQ